MSVSSIKHPERVVEAGHDSRPSQNRTLAEWLAWQESLHVTDIALGLDRCRRVAAELGLAPPNHPLVTVAGTNGKGSSVAMLENIWRGAGYRVGTYSSPHLLAYNERIRIDGLAASDTQICCAFERIERARRSIPLTYFEFGTLAALVLFEDAELDAIILEVGLGGRLDAVNIIDPDVSLITTIGIDHVEYLGDTRDMIGREKAGIMRAGRPTICSDADMPATVAERARELGVPLEVLGQSYRFSDDGDRWGWWTGDTVVGDLPKPALAGRYQLRNAAGVLRVIHALEDRLPVTVNSICEGLRTVSLRGRFQRVAGAVEHVLDVAHNAQAAEQFVNTLKELPSVRRTFVVVGMLKAKDHRSVFEHLASITDEWHLATLDAGRGASSSALRTTLETMGVRKPVVCYDDVLSAYKAVVSLAAKGDRIVAVGSFLVVSEVLKALAAKNLLH
jgi:dihydrofolate synthase/folylpolyglutamate synthase